MLIEETGETRVRTSVATSDVLTSDLMF